MQTVGQFPSHVQSHLQSPHPVSGGRAVEMESLLASRIAGISLVWRKLLLQAEMAAPHVQVATIEGESGVGKQTLARYLLAHSSLAPAGFHRCDAREWLLEIADPASVAGFTYLDRVDLLAPPGQSILLGILKTLQDRSPGNVMLVASSHMPLRQLAGQGHLLSDLAFRLTAVRFAIPPLRTRREDIAPLAQALLERICTRYQHRPVTLTPTALGRLLQHAWPGNIRELANVLEAALLEAVNDVIRPEDLQLHAEFGIDPEFQPGVHNSSLVLDDIIRRHVQYVLDLNHGNKLRAARQLRISRSTLYRILGNETLLTN